MQLIPHTIRWIIPVIFLAGLCNISTADSLPGYTIITTSDINDISQKLPDFITHKESVGFDVQVVTETDFGAGIGDEAAENIRAWLQANYLARNIEYVLFIGDLDPNNSEIPMKWLWADEGKLAASDFYFAELTGNWDLDGDGIAGEWGDDFGWQDVDRKAEVLVGRIPCYGDIDEVDHILHNTILYETSTSKEWRKSALLAMTNDGWVLGEAIKDEILSPTGWSWHRVYQENHGLITPPETIPCSQETICRVWSGQAQNSGGKFGLVIWAGEHGHAMVTPECDFNSDFPSFTFQPPCTEGGVTLRENLAYKLLKNGGAICTVAATLGTKYRGDMYVGNSNTMAFEYTSRLVAGLSAGEALYDLKGVMRLPRDMYWRNWVVYNIYGDPSLKLVSPIDRTTYVDSNATGHGDGSSWEDAYIFLQDALTNALPSDEIRVARGTYKPDQGIGIITGDRNASFNLKNGVELKGGFAGISSLDPNLRDIELFKTILSGDLDGNDVDVNELTRAENSYHVVTAPSGICRETIMDGVIITSGYADGENPNGAGMYIDGGHPTVCNCIFKQNHANSYGGAIYNVLGGIILRGCVFEYNSASYGGGIYNYTSNTLFTNCLFIGNEGQWGGAMNNQFSCTILYNCTLSDNQAYTFTANQVWPREGGALWNRSSYLFLTNCILWENFPDEIYDYDTETTNIVSYSNIKTTDEPPWPGEGNIYANPEFADANYHLKSQAGRWDPNSDTWVCDDVTSPCIDAGDPNSPVAFEPYPNGMIINMGAYGGTHEASMSLETGGLSLPDVAFICLNKTKPAQSFKALLEIYGCPTTLIKTKNVTATSLESCDLVIVANDTFYSHAWTEPNAIIAIENSGKPIVGLGEGGHDFFGLLGLSIGSHGAGFSQNNINVIKPPYSIFSTPYPIDIPQDGILQLYTETRNIALYLWPDVPETITVLAVLHNNPGYYPLAIEDNRYFLWGFKESPDKMTDIGKKLFINSVIWMANAGLESEN